MEWHIAETTERIHCDYCEDELISYCNGCDDYFKMYQKIVCYTDEYGKRKHAHKQCIEIKT